MTLHTRVMVTSPDVTPASIFIRMRQLIGAGEQYSATESDASLHMDVGQGLPALMWVDHANGALVSEGGHDEWCDDACNGLYDDPAGYVEINYDTAYAYRADNNASCSDLHAWLTREIGAWLTERGATWVWYDESGDGWHGDLSDYGTLGDPEVGRPGSTKTRSVEDQKRAFGLSVIETITGGAR